MNIAPGKIPPGGKSPRTCIYSAPAQETAKHRAKFGWPLDPVVDRVERTDRLGCFVDRLDRLDRLVDDFTTRLDLDDFRST